MFKKNDIFYVFLNKSIFSDIDIELQSCRYLTNTF